MQDSRKVVGYKPMELDDMLKKAIAKREEQIMQMVEREERIHRVKRDEYVREFKMHLSRMLSVPIIIGIAASIITYYRFGWSFLEQQLLSWLIGATVVTAVITLMERYGNLRV